MRFISANWIYVNWIICIYSVALKQYAKDFKYSYILWRIYFSWKDVFYDLESGIAYYMLEVGSKANIGDIVQSIETTEDCGVPIQYLDIHTHQGHAYFLTVKVRYIPLIYFTYAKYNCRRNVSFFFILVWQSFKTSIAFV